MTSNLTVVIEKHGDDDDNAEYENAMQIALQTLMMERGGQLTVSKENAASAMEKAARWFPKGAHMHMEWTDAHIKFTMENALSCPYHGDKSHKETVQ